MIDLTSYSNAINGHATDISNLNITSSTYLSLLNSHSTILTLTIFRY
jgi:hypothetical protein